MKLIIEPTEHFFMAGDVMVRMWSGTTDSGAEIVALVTCVAGADDGAELARSLVSIPPPDQSAAELWARTIMKRAETET